MTRIPSLAALACAVALAACAAPGTPAAVDTGPRVAIAVAPLDLPAVTDATFNLRVRNAAGDLVWERLALASSSFGDAAGALSYVGPCDAASNPNRVELELVDLTGPTPGSWMNPAPPGAPVAVTATCADNTDTPVTFDLTIARSGQDGFFDIGVNFEDVFCSAKLDCLDPDGDPLHLLHDATGARAQTAVVALACTAGGDQPTTLYRSDLTVTCAGGATYTFSPTAGLGNTGGQAPGIFQSAIYAGREDLPGADTCYWNVALGLDLAALGPDCTLTASATATSTPFVAGAIPAGHVWPVITWTAPLTDATGALACGRSALDGDDAVVTTTYSSADGATFPRQLTCATTTFDNPGAVACAGEITVSGDPGVTVEALTHDQSITLRAGDATSAPLKLPAGLALASCCADPCCQ